MTLDTKQKSFWDANGFLVLPSFFRHNEIDALDESVQKVWTESPHFVQVINLKTGRRSFMNELSREERTHHFKVMDLYLNYPMIRSTVLDQKLTPILKGLIGDTPVLGATLNFEKSSEQNFHADSIFLTPETRGHLAATWIALEDVHPDSGALKYIAGSHLIEPYRFSDGGYRHIEGEMDQWTHYMMGEVEKRELKSETFFAKKGDVFIWHSDLVHAGSKINNYDLTRKSLVSHYFSLSDSEALRRKLVPINGAYWHDRPPVGTTKQLSDVIPAAWMIKKIANTMLPQKVRTNLKGALARFISK